MRGADKDPKRRKYWGTLPSWSEEFAAAAIDRFEAFQKRLERSKRHSRIQRSWRMAFSRDQAGNADMTEIGSAGRKGEVLLLQPNRYARIIRNHCTLVQQTKSNPEPTAVNNDPQSQDEVKLARGIIEHYKRESDLDGIKVQRAFVAEICGDSYLHIPWDPQLGKEVMVAPRAPEQTGEPAPADEETVEPVDNAVEDAAEGETPGDNQTIVYEGDFRFSVRSIYEVAYDRTSPEPKKPRWWIVKEPVNRFDLLAQVEDETGDEAELERLRNAIRGADAWSDNLKKLDYDDGKDDYDDSIPVYYVYIDRSKACPEGRTVMVIDEKTVLIDGPMIEPRCPVFRLSQGEVLFRNEATTPNHDGLPLCEALAAQMSTILSNAANHGLLRIMHPRASNIDHVHLDTGAASVPYDHVDKAGNPVPKPETLQINALPPGMAEFYQILGAEIDLIMADSAVTRGDPSATRGDSGSKVAALFAAAQNVASNFVADVLRSEEEVYTFLIASMGIHATSKRVITIVGDQNSFAAKEFTADNLKRIVRVKVSQADAMRDTLPGRMAMAELLQGKTPEQQRQTIAILSTGNMEVITDVTEPARINLDRENEDLRNVDRPMPLAMPNDYHSDHWKSHANQLNDPDVRRNLALVERIKQHNAQHIGFLTPGDPLFDASALMMTGQNPLPSPQPQGKPDEQQQGAPSGQQGGPPQPQAPQAKPQIPGMPQPPKMPMNPISGQRMNPGPGGGAPQPQGQGVS